MPAVAPTPSTPSASPAPFALAIVVDRSGSMQGPRLDAVKQAIEAVAAALTGHDELAVIAFSMTAETWVELGPVGDLSSLHERLAKGTAGGGTDLRSGLTSAAAVLSSSGASRKHVLLVSDGESNYEGVEELVDKTAALDVTISAIGIGDADPKLLEIITQHGHGRLHMLPDLGELATVALGDVATARSSNP